MIPIKAPMPRRLLEAVGSMFLQSAAQESYFNIQVNRLIFHPEHINFDVFIINQGTGFNVLRQQMEKLAKAKLEEATAKMVARETNRLSRCFAKRNDFAHNDSYYDPESQSVVINIIKASKNGFPSGLKKYSFDDISAISAEMVQHVAKINDILDSVGVIPNKEYLRQLSQPIG